MDKKIIFALSLFFIVFVYGCAKGSGQIGTANVQGQAVAGDVGINRGNIAPDFTVKTIDGKTVSLSQLSKDKPTVLYFFATWCPNCARDLGAVSSVYPQYKDKVNFLAIDLDQRESEAQIASYRKRMNLPNIDFAAAKRDVLANYNVAYTTTKYFIGKDGTILNKGVGGVDENTWHQIFQAMSQ